MLEPTNGERADDPLGRCITSPWSTFGPGTPRQTQPLTLTFGQVPQIGYRPIV